MADRTSPATYLKHPFWPLGIILLFMWLAWSCEAKAGADDDRDGWYTAERNQRVTLTLAGLASNREGDYRVTIEGIHFPYTETDLQAAVPARPGMVESLDYLVTSRAIGTWAKGGASKEISWDSKVTLTRAADKAGASETGSATITWCNRAETKSVSIRLSPDEQVRLDFRVEVRRFKDFSPASGKGDADRDGILDFEEAGYARRGIGLGDPGRPDLILVAAHTHDDWRMTDLTKQLLRTRFHQRGINLYVVTEDAEGLGLCRPGLIKISGKSLDRDYAMSLQEVRKIRAANFKKSMLGHAHLVVLAMQVAPLSEKLWGRADLPGSSLVLRSHLPMMGPDFHQYQAKTLMHELGHNFGLCHPEDSGKNCMTGPIPESERDAGKTVMGTPKADRGNPMAVVKNAWARPLDYSPTQWKNARLDWVRRENRLVPIERKPRR